MNVQRTIRIRLRPTPEQRAALLSTMRQATACFNTVAAYGWEHEQRNGVELHKATYYPLRAEYPALPSQLVISARSKAHEALKGALTRKRQGRRVSWPFGTMVPIRYDARSHRLVDGAASLASVEGRQAVPYVTNPHARALLERAVGFDSADLILRDGKLRLHVVLSLPDVPHDPSGEVVGIDLGLCRPAVVSNNRFLGQRRWREVDRRYFRLCRSLQSKGTASAKRHLRQLRGKVARFRRDCDHVLSKRIVQSVGPGAVIAVENLTDIRGRVKQRGRASRRRLHSWSFAQLRGFLEYKAEAAGCVVVGVDPRHTSQRCPRCGETRRDNRHSQRRFLCRACGYELNADLVGARNVAWKYLATLGRPERGGLQVNQPIAGDSVALQHGSTCKPPALAGGC